MATTHYDFPTINGSDAIDGVNAINGLANAVDTALYAVDAAVIAQEGDIEEAKTNASSASAAAEAATTNAAAAQQSAIAAQNTAGAAQQTANNTAALLNDFEKKFNLTKITTVKTGLSFSGLSDYEFTLAKNSDGSMFKFYGTAYDGTTSSGAVTATRVSIPGLSGKTGLATGLYVAPPTTAYQIAPAGDVITWSNTGLYSSTMLAIAVGTDGQIYLFTNLTSNTVIPSGYGGRIVFYPCIYFNASFGDNPTAH